jgi:uncharacterized protein (TIGR00730 family)
MNICVFCSSRSNLDSSVFEQAKDFCDYLVKNKDVFIYGGSKDGLMGFFADQLIKQKAQTIGVIPTGAFDQEVSHKGLTELIQTKDMLDRKKKMMDLADAFVIFPGGIGTMDEALEVITWETVYKKAKPILFFNWQNFWTPFFNMLKEYEKTNLFYPETMTSFKSFHNLKELCEELEDAR